ncbi:class I SAM-dependent methyltransferase [Glycomyces tarimensis]
MSNYRDADHLKARVDLYRYRTPDFDPVDTAAGLLPSALGYLLDVGCGYGRYVNRLRADHPEATVVGIDLSPGMLTEVEPPVMVAAAEAVPYPDDSVDAVLAMHMLYHVPDIAKAVGEFRRVLKPGGTLLVSTNVEGDMAAMYELWNAAIASVLGEAAFRPEAEVARFDGANAPGYLEAAFASVERIEKTGTVSVPGPEPLLRYLASIRTFFDCDDEAFDDVLAEARRELEAHFARHDRFEFAKGFVYYRCR